MDARSNGDAEALHQHMLVEQVALMSRLSAIPLLVSTVIGAIVAWLAVEDSGVAVAAGWYCASMGMMVLRLRIGQLFTRQPRSYAEGRRWRTAMLLLIVVFGTIWGIPGA